ncbi:MBOAT family O-acyltransferase [Terriglobus saanensis]|uniref:Membrane bound O-acyl transferase MBOAT family protein n=1 Tax=Terriglobus saanensis (strain ATCC BAA-1853 / DSM 23119 / SP1PR4) TaxID=401053 RepID=E8V8I1_TERSS|nr:MBOAT family O-acyltransferase [Terriglobus saanensis]ADV82960.1 membrane bound O-acyl transferase MBOAT family protein [Terriglobus saanensis SP1PR4]
MLFNSYGFLFVFLPVTLLGFHLLGRFGRRPVILWLTLMSVVFYSAWNRVFVLFLLGSIATNFALSRWIADAPENSHRRKALLWCSVGANLLALFYFKYLFTLLTHLAGHHWIGKPHPILLPLGISFFTFTQISYLIDLAQGQAEEKDFLSYLLFVTFFPHLIAGPILHHKEMMPQFAEGRRFQVTAENFSLGFTWFVFGLAKKVLIADHLAAKSDFTFSHAGALGLLPAWTGLVVYSMQLYFDFSGYSDMAIGLARMFGIEFPMNFNSPWKATSVTEYWQRWHITLTRYITLYLYNPLLLGVQRRRMDAGKKVSRKSLATLGGFTAMVAYPTMLTMLLTGMWHGAGLQFLLFGVLHGIYLTAAQAWRHFRPNANVSTKWPVLGMRVGVYLQVAFALVFFRSASLGKAFAMIADMAGRHGLGQLDTEIPVLLAFALFPVVWYLPNTQEILGQQATTEVGLPLLERIRWRPNMPWACATAAVFFAVLVLMNEVSTFLYFQF